MTKVSGGSGSPSFLKIRIPDRLYFRIGDVADLVGVKPYVLRYWETEFPMIAPQKSSSGQRVYRRSDVETILLIKHLLYEERYSIDGARRKLRDLRRQGQRKLKDYVETLDSPGEKLRWMTEDETEASDASPLNSQRIERAAAEAAEMAEAAGFAIPVARETRPQTEVEAEPGPLISSAAQLEIRESVHELVRLAAERALGPLGPDFFGSDMGSGATAAGAQIPVESARRVSSGLRLERLTEILGAARDLHALADLPIRQLYPACAGE